MTIPNADVFSMAARTEMSNFLDLHGSMGGEPIHPWIPEDFVNRYANNDEAIWGDLKSSTPLRRLSSVLVCPTWHEHICSFCGYGPKNDLASDTETYWTGALVALSWEDLPDLNLWRRASLSEIVCALAQDIGAVRFSTNVSNDGINVNFKAFFSQGKIMTECMHTDSDPNGANVLWIRKR